jgi:thiol:disulfide interchange protein
MTPVYRVLSALLLLAAVSAAQEYSDSKVRVKRAAIENGTVVLDLRIEPGWHIYSVSSHGDHAASATRVSLDKPHEIGGELVETKPIHHKKDYIDEDTKEVLYSEEYDKHEGDVTLRVPVKGALAGSVKGSIRVIACDANKCLPEGSVKFTAAPGGAAAPSNGPGGPHAGVQASESRAESKPTRKVVKDPKRLGKFREDDPVRVVEISYPDPITSDRFDLRVVIEIGEEYHIYGLSKAGTGVPTAFKFPKTDAPVTLARNGEGKSDPPPKHRKKDFEDYEYFEGRVAFDIPVRAVLAAGAASETGDKPFTFKLATDYQTCTMQFCLLPADAEFELTATATLGPAFVSAADVGATPGKEPECAALDVKVTSEPAPLEPGSEGYLVARVRRADGKACASDAPRQPAFNLGQGANLFVAGPAVPTAEADGSVTLRLPVRVSGDAADGSVPISGTVTVGASTADFAGSVDILAPLAGFLILAAIAALAALLTPCVFPMIPVTMSFFTKQSESGQAHPAKLAFVYCAGIIVSFTAIGALFTAALSGDAANQFAGHWLTQIVITALFVFFALSLLGMFDLSVPQPIMNMVERTTTRRMEFVEKGKGVMFAVLLMGLLFSITTFTCTAPFIGGLLAGASASGQFTRPILGMAVFATTLAIPFFFLAVFPAQLKKLPKAGGWLNETKVVMGFVELAAAVKFINGADTALGWGFFTRNVCLAIWIAIHVLTGLYLLGLIRLPKDMPRQKTGVLALLVSMLFLTIAVYLMTGLNGRPLSGFVEGWLPPIEKEFTGAAAIGHGRAAVDRVGWDGRFDDDYEGALAEAKRRGLPLLIDFTGYNCANCRAVEGVIFEKNQEVRGQLEKTVMVSLHLDGGDAKEANNALLNKFKLPTAMPTYVVLDPTYTKLITHWGSLGHDAKDWKAQMNEVLQRWQTLKK